MLCGRPLFLLTIGGWNKMGYMILKSKFWMNKIKRSNPSCSEPIIKSEGLEHAVWSAGIHYNTDNLHVHIATVEPYPMREK